MLNRRSFLKTSGGMAAACVLSPTHAFAKIAHPLKPFPKTSDRPLPLFVYHRMCFGPTGVELASDRPFQFKKYLETQLHPEAISDLECTQKLKDTKLLSLDKSLKDCWKDYKIAADDLKKKEETAKAQDKSKENEIRQTPIHELEASTWIRAIYSEKQLQEVLVQFWHDHFNINGWDNSISPTMIYHDRDVIRKHAFGNFRDMVEAVTKSPAMLLYLDNGLNQSANPNENFAREVFELHTLGAENYYGTLERRKVLGFNFGKSKGYVDGDVYEAARAFTGWREDSNQKDATNTGEFSYYEAWHDRFQKIVLGHAIPEYQPPEKDGMDVIALVSKHEGTAHAICKKLCRRFISDHPPESLIKKAKKVFIAHQKDPDQIRKVVHTILQSPEFQNPFYTKLKRPFEFAVSMIRGLKTNGSFNFIPDEEFLKRQGGGGQRLFQWKTPDGYPDVKERWTTASGLLYRFQFANQLLEKKLLDVTEFAKSSNPVFDIQKKIMGYTTESQTHILNDFLKDHLNASNKTIDQPTLKASVLLEMMSPELQWK